MKILVTGANGVIGRALCSVLAQTENQVVKAVRKSRTPWEIPVGDLSESTNWSEPLSSQIDVVVHLAAQVPSTDSTSRVPSDQYTKVNTLGTVNLARQCAQHGVKRFIFVSTIKVLGEGKSEPYRDSDSPMPADAYAFSKWEGEQALWKISSETNMEIVIIRPPLVFGPGIKGNFLRLMQAVDARFPLPLGAIKNQRSLIYLGNLVDVICVCLTHPNAAGKAFLISDGDDISTPDLIRRIAAALGRRPFLLPVPVSWMRWAGNLLGKHTSVDRLTASLCVDISPLRDELGWNPPYTLHEGLEATTKWYRETRSTE